MDDKKKKISKEEKNQEKLRRLNEKRLKKAENKKQFDELFTAVQGHDGTHEGKIKAARAKKIKKHKDKISLKQVAKEGPVKFLKEINKIKWSTRENLSMKFLWVIVFILIFGIFFFAVDYGLQHLFVEIKII
ncbi:preprotein translocase subunit SecE [Spiroplasma corruscae]|uniref:Preprotein translocase subunit SecE n=1 Tax=Spiroplasma corruscae TaxID=216934 RepID=A0A222EMR8_9MOLU|nr:preprotein translocase subunit SecE [Spiroplasma corruscae]ASP27807.1 preprotein translocase subunit SecE [Spiroplasma corruscae]